MTPNLLAAIAGLAALDSLNPATIAGVALILLAPVQRPIASAVGYAVGAYLAVLALGIAVYTGASLAVDTVAGALTWVRRGALGLAALLLLIAAARRLKPRQRSAVVLPRWVGPWTAAPLESWSPRPTCPTPFPT